MLYPGNGKSGLVNFGRNDFLFLKQGFEPVISPESVHRTVLFNYHLYTKMQVCMAEAGAKKLVMLGQIFSAVSPQFSNQEITNSLAKSENFEEVLSQLRMCTGRFLVFLIDEEKIQFVGDALGQFEVYYDDSFSGVASNLSILSQYISLHKWEGPGESLYKRIANTTRIQVGTTTAYNNAKHLMPNHYALSTELEQIRFFPTKSDLENKLTLRDGVDQLVELMKNFAISMDKRHKLALPLTAGRDSRLLLGLFKDFNLKLFVFKHPQTSEEHYDIKTGKRLAAMVGKDYDVIKYKANLDKRGQELLDSFSEKPRDNPIPYLINAYTSLSDCLILNGHGGEVGRAFFGKVYDPNYKKLATILGYPKEEFVYSEMKKWIDDINQVGDIGNNFMDYFYWEQRMGNWGARIKTETANVVEMVAPMNSHAVISRFLAVPKKNRRFYSNDLFHELILKIDPNLLKYPFNPSKKNKLIAGLIKLRVYWLYRNLRLIFQYKF